MDKNYQGRTGSKLAATEDELHPVPSSDQQRAQDQQRQTTLATYLDNMRDLLLNKGLFTSKPGDEVRVIARVETLSAMRQLDSKRNSFLVWFLQDAGLLGEAPHASQAEAHIQAIIDFSGADLSNIDLSGAYLGYVHFSGADLSRTNLTGANLIEADLTAAWLAHGLLVDAQLARANLTGATLTGANLTGADFYEADLSNADLSGANLSNAGDLIQQQLDQVSTCKGTILPKGLTCHHN